MNLKDLSKAQQQYLAAGVLGVVVLVVLLAYGFKFGSRKITDAQNDLDALTKKIESADRALSRRTQTSLENARVAASLRDYLLNSPPENYYAASEAVYPKAKKLALEIDSIDEVKIRSKAAIGKRGAEFRFETYTIKITARGGYDNVKTFLSMLAKDFPLARVTGIEISVGSSPESHNVLIFVQWPFNFAALAKDLDEVKLQPTAKVAGQFQPEATPPEEVAPKEPFVEAMPEPVPHVTTAERPATEVAAIEPEVQSPVETTSVPVPSVATADRSAPAIATSESAVQPFIEEEPLQPIKEIVAPNEVTSGKYITTRKSADKLGDLLNQKRQPRTSTTSSLDSFLENMVEEANDNP